MSSSNPQIHILTNDIELEEWPEFPETAIEEGSRGQSGKSIFEDSNVSVGIWSALPNRTAPLKFSYTEYMVILEGQVTIEDLESHQSRSFSAGDCFLAPAGLSFRWNQSAGKIRKIYFVVEETPAIPSPHHRPPVAAFDSLPSLHAEQRSNAKYDTLYQVHPGRFAAGFLTVSASAAGFHPLNRHELISVVQGTLEIRIRSEGQVEAHSTHVLHAGQSALILSGAHVALIPKSEPLKIAFAAVHLDSSSSKL